VKDEPGITPVETSNPQMVTVEASEEAASRLRHKLRDTHYVELETRHKLH